MPATEQYWRHLPTMHRIFAASTLVLLFGTIWMMAADHDDEWRVYQKTFQKYSSEKLQTQIVSKETPEYKAEVAELSKELQATQADLNQHKAEIRKLDAVVAKDQGDFSRADRNTKFERAKRDVYRANYDIAIRDAKPQADLDSLKKIFDDQQNKVVTLETQLQAVQARLDQSKAALAVKTEAHDKVEARLKKVTGDIDRLHGALVKLTPDDPVAAFKRWTMELPIVDGFNSHLKIQQDWLPNLTINYGGMTDVARFDRCRTCHQGIDLVEAGGVPAYPASKYAQPFSTHPRTDVFLTSSSPHPIQKFGCTICHEGQGSGTSFTNASHSPNDPHIGHEWADEYKWFNNHFWEYPMNPQRFTESGCLKCHHSVVELGVNSKFGPTAPKVFEGYNLIREYGCFGCHEINGFDGGKSIGPDLRLEPDAQELAKMAGDPTAVPGTMRKVGPSLMHIRDKTTTAWTEFWTEEPMRFRPTTRMPQFFHLEGQLDAHDARLTPVEIASLVHYLFDKSTPLDPLKPADGYEPNIERGKVFFTQKGCLGCHSHEEVPGIKQDFGPELSRVHEKLLPGEKGMNWLYTWIRDPERHHPRTRMPNLYLTAYTEGGVTIDPAADIAAWLLSKGPGQFEELKKDTEALHELTVLYLSKALSKEAVDKVLTTGWYPESDKEKIKGDEVELFTGAEGSGKKLTDAQLWNYVGRRTVARYGCYGCHDIPGFEKGRPIGPALSAWGRKDKSKLAFEHIHEFLHHHGEPDGSSTKDRVDSAMKRADGHEFTDKAEEEAEMSTAYFYEQVMHGDRPGFLWQKLRSPRSYDYKKIETKGFDERLKMPKFPLTDAEREAIATFVLGLVAEPPATQYQFRPQGPAKDVIEGEKLLAKFNCTGCHIVDLPEIKFGVNPDEVAASELGAGDYQESLELLLQLKPPRQGLTGEKLELEDKTELPIVSFHGLLAVDADPEADPADREYGYDLWETLRVGDKLLVPSSRLTIPEANRHSVTPARGGAFAEFLVGSLMAANRETNRNLAWQASPPPLYLEGTKVQTNWLYNFLRNPHQIRHTTVLRMPRFNMSDAEALTLANYFAAVDGAAYPYQTSPQREQSYLAAHGGEGYLEEAWKTLNAPLCIKCHSVGGREYKASDPKKDIRGPNLVNVSERLRPDWALLWIYKPNWITPYTSMPQNFPKNQKQFEQLFEGDARLQTIAVRDALFNYHHLLEKEGKFAGPVLPTTPPAEGAAAPTNAN